LLTLPPPLGFIIQQTQGERKAHKANLENELPQDLKGSKVQLLLQVPLLVEIINHFCRVNIGLQIKKTE